MEKLSMQYIRYKKKQILVNQIWITRPQIPEKWDPKKTLLSQIRAFVISTKEGNKNYSKIQFPDQNWGGNEFRDHQ